MCPTRKKCYLSMAFLWLGSVLVIGALCLTCFKIQEAKNAEESAAAAYLDVQNQTNNRGKILQETQIIPDYEIDSDLPMPVCDIGNWSYIGSLSIPAIGKTLPVMNEWSYTGLKVSPGRYLGSAYTGDLIICGHNYNSHFGLLKTLAQGDVVSFTDMDGNEFHYTVSQVEILDRTDLEGMKAGDWDLTLFTCTIGGKQRVTVRCVLTEDKGGASL